MSNNRPLKFSIAFIIIATLLVGFKTNIKDHWKHIDANKTDQAIDTSDPCFLIISDIHLEDSLKQQDIKNNTGYDLWDATKKEMVAIIKTSHPSFILVLGDITRHEDISKKDSNSVRENLQRVIVYFKDTAKIASDVPLIYIPGNNDSWNGDYSAFYLPDLIYNNYGYPFINVSSSITVSGACIANDSLQKQLGCFSIYPLGKKNKLRLIVLNTVIFSTNNKAFPYASTNSKIKQRIDAKIQMDWFAKQLKEATNLNEHILIAMHIPPGTDGHEDGPMWYVDSDSIQNKFLQLTWQYQKNIIGLLASHTHMDGIRLLRNYNKDSVISLLISAPGITPGHGNNPAIKLVTYNPADNYSLQNFTTAYMNYWGTKHSGIVKTWNPADSFSFRTVTGYNGTMSMLQYFQNTTPDNIKSFVDSIYTANSPKKYPEEIDTTIYVDWYK
jgi:sphingomyelin phosphodiesterase acid-like 3